MNVSLLSNAAIHTSTFNIDGDKMTIKELNTSDSVNYLPVFKRIFLSHFTSLLLFASQSVSECGCCQQGMRGAVVGGGRRRVGGPNIGHWNRFLVSISYRQVDTVSHGRRPSKGGIR